MDVRPRCTATKADGTPCQAAALPGKPTCVFHDPSRQAEGEAARSRGGRASHKPPAVVADAEDVAFTTVPDVVRFLAATASQVRRGELDCRLGNCLTYIAATALRAVQPDDVARQVAELRRELEALKGTADDCDGDAQGAFGPPPGNGVVPGDPRPHPPPAPAEGRPEPSDGGSGDAPGLVAAGPPALLL